MIRRLLLITGGAVNVLWGIAHLFPVNSVVKGFGDITPDNQRIVFMEWINEGMTLIFLGIVVITVTMIEKNETRVKKIVYVLVFVMLVSMAVLSLFTGFKINFLPFRLCPVIFSVSGLMILQGAFGNRKN